jgi:predicted transcriptional regulator
VLKKLHIAVGIPYNDLLNFQHVGIAEREQMPRLIGGGLSRREREMVEILHRLGQATAAEVHEQMPHAPTYSAVRATLRILEEKGHVYHEADGKRFVYVPSMPKQDAAKSALEQVVNTFFGGSLEGVVRTFLSSDETSVSADELEQLSVLIEEAKRKEIRQ